MTFGEQIAKHFRDLHFGGNWTAVNLKDQLSDVSWQQATKKLEGFHTIAELAFHINYFVGAVLNVLKGGPLDAHDKYSFDVPEISSHEKWQALLDRMWAEAKEFAELAAKLQDDQLEENLADPKYGSWYRNISGIIEHSHYHLGQIVKLRKLIGSNSIVS